MGLLGAIEGVLEMNWTPAYRDPKHYINARIRPNKKWIPEIMFRVQDPGFVYVVLWDPSFGRKLGTNLVMHLTNTHLM